MRGMYLLALCYETGKGVIRDLEQAITFYQKAANKGYEEAKFAFDRLKLSTVKPQIQNLGSEES
jgi:TPR repeat protein